MRVPSRERSDKAAPPSESDDSTRTRLSPYYIIGNKLITRVCSNAYMYTEEGEQASMPHRRTPEVSVRANLNLRRAAPRVAQGLLLIGHGSWGSGKFGSARFGTSRNVASTRAMGPIKQGPNISRNPSSLSTYYNRTTLISRHNLAEAQTDGDKNTPAQGPASPSNIDRANETNVYIKRTYNA